MNSNKERRAKRQETIKKIIAWLLAVLLILGMLTPLLSVFGEKTTESTTQTTNTSVRANAPSSEKVRATVTADKGSNERGTQTVEATVSEGVYKGQVVEAIFERNAFYSNKYALDPLTPGTNVILLIEKDKYGAISKAYVADINREGALLSLVLVFFGVLILVGGLKGVKAIASLVITGLALFFVFIPGILSGHDPVILSILVCMFVISVSFLIISGFTRKTLAAIVGTTVGIIIAGLLFLLFSNIMRISGISDEHARNLLFIPQQIQFEFKGLLFAGILIASMGACMDIGMTIASTVNEISESSPGISKLALFKAGANVGKDAMATMTNTLILAYAGTSLNIILLLKANSIASINFMNWEVIVVEITRALTATIGLVAAIPITAFIATELFDKKRAK